jgi:iron(III) transport system ATP-binding protein
MTAIRIESISKRFGQTVALENVSLEVEAGEIFFLLGPSGCGKTTLLRVVAGLETPDTGRVFLDGRDVTSLPARLRESVMVFQSYALWPHMSVERNVGFGLEVRGMGRAERRRAVGHALEQVRLGDLAERKPGQLSGGQQQRVALARALVVRPAVLLLDEQLSNLDAGLRSEMRTEIRRLCKSSGLTAIYVTHDQHEAMAISDRIALLDDGRLEQVGTPHGIYSRPASRFAAEFMGVTNLLPATLTSEGPPAVLETQLGEIRAARPLPGGSAGQAVQVSIRPESWLKRSAGDPAHAMRVRGRVVEATFLGERAEYVVRAGAVEGLVVFDPGPSGSGRAPGDEVDLCLDPEDVVILPADGGDR